MVSGAPGGGLKSHIGDAPVLPDLLSQIPENQEIGSVTAGGACDTRRCHDEIAECGAHAVIPPRKNEKPWKTIRFVFRHSELCDELGIRAFRLHLELDRSLRSTVRKAMILYGL